MNKDFQLDPVSSKLASDLENKEREEAGKRAREKERKDDAMRRLKTAVLISAAAVAVTVVPELQILSQKSLNLHNPFTNEPLARF
ncbi:unnamed protein product [Cuscuta campestris]|uniref:Uncharacterized protein n=1 Tax=Cuscuta campestris TaxID=132261 RepID=A0A484LTZ5_9ASTE|nr:unnamed protein product [Cuscuta campestris]